MKYYTEESLGDNLFIRLFNPTMPPMWHKDLEDRYIYTSENTDWKFQYDNELPVRLEINKQLFIPKNTFHRLISDNITKLSLYIIKK